MHLKPDSLTTWPTGVSPGDPEGLAAWLRGQGFLQAEVDSLGDAVAYVTQGPRYTFGAFVVDGSESGLSGRPLSEAIADSVANSVLERLERAGRIGASMSMDSLSVADGRLRTVWTVNPGRQALLQGLLIGGRSQASERFVRLVSRLEPGMVLTEFDIAEIRARLMQTGVFADVQGPILLPTSDSTAVVQLVLEDRPPGSFDLALGYLPGPSSGTVVGSGHLLLRNLFGGGRTVAVELDRLPGQSSSFAARLHDPFVLGPLVGAELEFDGYQEDSTFSRQEYRGRLLVRLGQVTLTGTATRTASRPGTAGGIVQNGRQRVPRSRTRAAGLGLRFDSRDDALSPASGQLVDISATRGTKRSSGLRVQQGDTVRVSEARLQDRLEAIARVYVPVARRIVLAGGADVRVVSSQEVEPSDLFRLGGATSLRGYDENRFRGEAVGRSLLEIRRRLEGAAYTYAFIDHGFVTLEGNTTRHTGFGLGAQLQTGAGLLNVSYAVNRDHGLLNGRVHLGLAFGL